MQANISRLGLCFVQIAQKLIRLASNLVWVTPQASYRVVKISVFLKPVPPTLNASRLVPNMILEG